jgi:hypothetical protein
MKGLYCRYAGANFATVRAALCAIYFLDLENPMSKAEWQECLQYVVPMQHNWNGVIKPGSQDTWIQYWIDQDDRWTQDSISQGQDTALKLAKISVRFLGVRAEEWAKAFHHLTKRQSIPLIFQEYCNGRMLEYVSPIVPQNVDYFGAGNTTIAHDLSFDLRYEESIDLGWKPLEYISVAPGKLGEVIGGAEPAEAG